MSDGADRIPDDAQILTRALDLRLARTYVMRVGKIEKFYADRQQADVKLLLMNSYEDKTGARKTVSLPVISNVPVAFMGGVQGLDTFPVAKGDECMLLFADRSLDKWLENGGEQDPGDGPHHDVTDAIAIVGVRSKGNKLTEFDENRKVLALKTGAPRIALGEDNIDLGVDHNENAGDNVALASLVKTELNNLKTALQNFVNTFNSHQHLIASGTIATQGTPVAHTNGAPVSVPAPLVSAQGPQNVQDVKSTIVRCK